VRLWILFFRKVEFCVETQRREGIDAQKTSFAFLGIAVVPPKNKNERTHLDLSLWETTDGLKPLASWLSREG